MTWVRRLTVAPFVLVASGLLLHLILLPSPERADQEKYSVYSAYVESGMTGESHSFGRTGDLVVILRYVGIKVADLAPGRFPWRFGSLSNMRRNIPQVPMSLVYNFVIANIGTHALERKFTLPSRYELITSADFKDSVPQDVRFAGSYGYLSFSAVAFNRDFTEALFHADHLCGLCGGGEYVWMRKVNGTWIIEGRSSIWVS